MKKILVLVALFGLTLSVSAQRDAFFNYGYNDDIYNRNVDMPSSSGLPSLPQFGGDTIQETTVPLGTGIFLLTALGAGYAISKRRKEER